MSQTPPAKDARDRVDRTIFAAIERTAAAQPPSSPSDTLVVPASPHHLFTANGATKSVVLKAEAIPARPHWWAPIGAQIATAALVLVLLVGSLVAYGGPLRQQGEESQHAMLPALAGTLEHVWTSAGGPPVNSLYGLGIDPQGDIWVSDASNDRFQILTPDGAHVETWGIPGDAEGELDGPSDMAVDTLGRVYVADTFNHRLQVFAEDGRFLAEVDSSPGSGPLPYVAGVVVTTDGVVVAAHNGGVEAYRLQLPAGDELMN